MLLFEIVEVSKALRATRSRTEKRDRIAALLQQMRSDEIAIGTGFLIGEPLQGRFGVGWASVSEAKPDAPPSEPELTLQQVHQAIDTLRSIEGDGSKAQRRQSLEALLSRATKAERDFLSGLFVGNLRQGALEGVMADAIARAFSISGRVVRRAHMLSASLPEIARLAQSGGSDALAAINFELFRPILPMLASPADDAAAVLQTLPEAIFEPKLDGVRLQIHRRGSDVAVFTRGLDDITRLVPEIVALAEALPGHEIVLDGEAIALRENRRPHPFQVTMRRFGRAMTRRKEAQLVDELPLTLAAFDCLYLDGSSLLDETTATRLDALDAHVPLGSRLERLHTDDAQSATQHLATVLDAGHEGLLAKDPAATYAAGRRGKSWLKLKRVHTLDLVVLAVEWGSGRRKGKLSNIHLGARDPKTGQFVMLGKTFKGMTDAMLEWQTQEFLARETHRERHVVYVRPEVVVEIALDGLQQSHRYPAKMALRFARVKRYRPDKSPLDADTLETVRAIYEADRV